MKIPILKPNKFLFDGYLYVNRDLIEVVVVDVVERKWKKQVGLYLIPHHQNAFGQECPLLFLEGYLEEGTNKTVYLFVNHISTDPVIAEDFLNANNVLLYDIPEETLICLLKKGTHNASV